MRYRVRALAAALLFVFAGGAMWAKGNTVTITYTLTRLNRMGSNQVAVWIEDGQGKLVKTIFATDFMAMRKGRKIRPQCCPEWVKAADLENMSDEEIDAISGATQKPGKTVLTWDCTDTKGKPVPPGAYLYKVEGNIAMEQRVVWTGGIVVGKTASTSAAFPLFMPDARKTTPTLLADVAARFSPAE